MSLLSSLSSLYFPPPPPPPLLIYHPNPPKILNDCEFCPSSHSSLPPQIITWCMSTEPASPPPCHSVTNRIQSQLPRVHRPNGEFGHKPSPSSSRTIGACVQLSNPRVALEIAHNARFSTPAIQQGASEEGSEILGGPRRNQHSKQPQADLHLSVPQSFTRYEGSGYC